jgi:hypothetical protein
MHRLALEEGEVSRHEGLRSKRLARRLAASQESFHGSN